MKWNPWIAVRSKIFLEDETTDTTTSTVTPAPPVDPVPPVDVIPPPPSE